MYTYDYSKIPLASIRSKIYTFTRISHRRRKYDIILVYKMITGVLGISAQDFYSYTY